MKKIIGVLTLLICTILTLVLVKCTTVTSLEALESFVPLTCFLSIITVLLTELSKRVFVGIHGLGLQVVSLFIGVTLALFLWILTSPLHLGVNLFIYIMYGFVISFVANGFYNVGIVPWINKLLNKNR